MEIKYACLVMVVIFGSCKNSVVKTRPLVEKITESVYAAGIVRLELEQRELAYQSSKTAMESAKIKYSDLLKQLEFTAKQSNNNLALSKYKEGDYIIKSEINGKVYFLEREPGEIVNPQTPLAVIGDATTFLLELQIDEYDIVKIKLGQAVAVSMDSYKGRSIRSENLENLSHHD